MKIIDQIFPQSIRRFAAAILILAATLGGARAEVSLEFRDSTQWTYNQDCVASGDTLITALTSGLQFWDIVDPAAPVMFAELYADGLQPWAVDRAGDTVAYTTAAGGLVAFVDIADPAAPVAGPSLAGIGNRADVTLHVVADTLYAFTAGRTTFGLNAVRLEDGIAHLHGSLNLTGLSGVAAAGDTLLVTGLSSGLHVVDATDPAHMQVVATLPLDGELLDVAVAGDLAAVAAADSGFHVIDISDLSAPALLATVRPTVNPDYADLTVKEVTLSGTRIIALAETAGPLVYETDPDPAAPALVAYDPALDAGLPFPYQAFRGACASGDLFFASHFNGTLPGALIFDLAETDLAPIGSTTAYDYVRYASADGDRVYSCAGEMGVFAWERNGNDELDYLGRIQLVEAWGVEARGDTAFVASTSDGLVAVDFGDPGAPAILGSVDMGQARGVEVVGDIAYVVAFTQGVHTVDVSDLTAPVLLDSETAPGMEAIRISVQDTLAATADRSGGMNLWHVGDPTDIVHLGNYPTANRVLDVELHGDVAYVAVDREGVHVVDIADPTLPAYVGLFEEEGESCEVREDKLIVAAGAYGVMVYDIADPLDPLLATYADTNDNAMAVCVDGQDIYVADNASLMSLHLDPATGVDDQPSGFAPLLANYPNPFNPRTNIAFDLPEAGRYRLSVFDVRGRRVVTLAEGDLAAGAHSVVWTGVDENGNEMPSGVYFARLAGATDSGRPLGSTHKLTLLR